MTRFDRWSRDGMPDGAELDKIQRGIDATMRNVIANRSIPQSASMIPDRQRSSEGPPRAVSAETPITPPPGIKYIDQMCDAADKRDRAALIRQQMENSWIDSLLEEPSSRVQSDFNPFSAENMKK